jgi:tetratricopeptide (TPR) repeat protein
MAGSRGSRTARKKKLVRRQQQQLASGWTENKVRVLSSEVILERLASLGIVTAADEFVEQARTEHAASTIAAQWRERLAASRQGVDDDFIDLAARVLWDRLLPERPSFEMLDERMQAGYAAFWANDVVRACDEWLAVWEGFKPHLGPEMTRVRDVDALFHGSEYFFNWCQEFENELGNAGVHDPRYWRARIQYVNEFLRQFSAEDDQPLLGNCLRAKAEALWSLGERARAEEQYEALIARLPNFAWGYIGLADCYWLAPDPTPEPKEYARAEAIYQRALGVPTLEDRAAVFERLADLYDDRGDAATAQLWRDQAEAEGGPSPADLWPEPAVTPSVMAGASHKLGRNERCWCGSGLKYKRCHFDADRGLLHTP